LHENDKGILIECATKFVLIKSGGHVLKLLHPAAQFADFLPNGGQTLLIIPSDSLFQLVYNSILIQHYRLGLSFDFLYHNFH